MWPSPTPQPLVGIRGNCRCGVWSQKGERKLLRTSEIAIENLHTPGSYRVLNRNPPNNFYLFVKMEARKLNEALGQDKSKRRVWISDCAGEPALSVYNRISDKRKRYPIINQRKNLHYSEKRARHGETRKEKVVLCKARKKDRFEKEAQTCKDSPTWTIKKVWLTSSSTSGIGTLTWAFTEG